jgi:transcriptional antiterminator Rof (Rho-off)
VRLGPGFPLMSLTQNACHHHYYLCCSMKLPVQYVNDADGNVQAVQIPIKEWEKHVLRVRRYEQLLKLRSDITEALAEVEKMRKGKLKKRTLASILNGT